MHDGSMATLRVRDLMTSGVLTLEVGGNLAEASDLMNVHRIRHLPILDDDGALVGLVSQRDLLRGALGGGADLPASIQRAYLRSIPVDEVMIRNVETVEPAVAIRDAAARMIDLKIGSLLVVEGPELVGILTESDFVRWVQANA